VVITNHGPADIRYVKVEVLIEGGEPMALPDLAAVPESSANHHPMF
jgi:hypothetical protein